MRSAFLCYVSQVLVPPRNAPQALCTGHSYKAHYIGFYGYVNNCAHTDISQTTSGEDSRRGTEAQGAWGKNQFFSFPQSILDKNFPLTLKGKIELGPCVTHHLN